MHGRPNAPPLRAPPCRKRFVEEQLARRLGRRLPDAAAAAARRPKTLEELALEAVAPRQQMLDIDPGAAFVAGVAEVALDVEVRLRNIEATEAAKAKLLAKGGAAARAALGDAGYDDDDDDEDAGGGGGAGAAARRGNFPVRFGHQNPKEVAALRDVAAKKAIAREKAAEAKKHKQQREFGGW